MDNQPICLLWYGYNGYEVAENRCLERGATIVEIDDETSIPTLLRKYRNTKADLTSFWVKYSQEIWILKASGMEKASNLQDSHGIIRMKKPIYPYRLTGEQISDCSRERRYKVNDNTSGKSQLGFEN